jgi:dTMP kinase
MKFYPLKEAKMFITFEGSDGTGKSTQIELLKTHLKNKGYPVYVTREPGGTRIGEKIRNIILDPNTPELSYITEALLYAASRIQHVEEVIIPNLKQKNIVICDRYVDSSIAYQGFGRNLLEYVTAINMPSTSICMPDITFMLEMDLSDSRRRVGKNKDRLENEKIDFYELVSEGYESIKERDPDRVIAIDAGRSISEISEEINSIIDEKIKQIKKERSGK